MAGRGVHPSASPCRGRLLSSLPPATDPDALLVSGKVLDSSAMMCWVRGSLAMGSWSTIASDLGLTLLVPAGARDEALIARPDDAELVDTLLAQPVVVVDATPSSGERERINARHLEDGVFDPLAWWVAALCRERGWAALSSDPMRLRRIDPSLQIDLL